mmetsp:Transcript_9292/g.15917  ORF Transcript_9292/g.15917 Transcript_9292/m.15917 type:complete len:83 (+) Transcript_9292:645-893(+)
MPKETSEGGMFCRARESAALPLKKDSDRARSAIECNSSGYLYMTGAAVELANGKWARNMRKTSVRRPVDWMWLNRRARGLDP